MESRERWEQIYSGVPLSQVPGHFAGIASAPFLQQYLAETLRRCPRGGRACETGIGSGYGAIWLSLRGVDAEGIDLSPRIVERARQVNSLLGGRARFSVGDLFRFDADHPRERFDVIHHQGVLEHLTLPEIQAALAQQVTHADWVVFSVPSVYYPFEPEFGNERLMPLEEWERILQPFDIADLRYYGDPRLGGQEHVLGVLTGQAANDELRSLMTPPAYPEGISAIVHTRNEARQIADCLETLRGWTDEIILCDMESEDNTVEIARRHTDNILIHPRITNFDRARNVSAMRARYRWVFYLDADERVPPGLGARLRELTAAGAPFDGLMLPFRHFFAGRWMQSLYPGYTAPRLFRNGRFFFNARLHSGAKVEGETAVFPADDPDLAIQHYSFESLAHHLDKVNRYTEGEAENLHRDGVAFHWQEAIRGFVQDFQMYYDRGQGARDGVHGLLWGFQSGLYRFEQHAKLYERRFRQGQLQPEEMAVPASVEQFLELALTIARQRPLPAPAAIQVGSRAGSAGAVFSGPLHDPSGYGDGSRDMLLALIEAGVDAAAQPIPWSGRMAPLTDLERKRLEDLAARSAAPGFDHISYNFAPFFIRHPQSRLAIGRTMFETDRLPREWVAACNRMDSIWVPSEFNRRTFTQAGVEERKLVVVPECLDPEPFTRPLEPPEVARRMGCGESFVFLSIFDWTLHKGWDVLLAAFIEAFEGRDDVALALKVWSTLGYDTRQIREQATSFVRRELDYDLDADTRIRFVDEWLTREGLAGLYQAVDCFVLPSRGEGWGRPYMEAMASGLPVIATNWSGNTAFMDEENSYLLEYELAPVPEQGWREIPTYRGHRWAEPDRRGLVEIMRRVVEERDGAREVGRRAREQVRAGFSREAVGRLAARELKRLREENTPHPVSVSDRSESPLGTPPRVVEGIRAASHSLSPITVRWEGAQLTWHSLAHVNRELCLGLLESGRVEMSLDPTDPSDPILEQTPRFQRLAERAFAPLSRPADVQVRHFFPPRLDAPEEGRLVLIQPWEYGYLPKSWIQPIRKNVTEIWCYSQYVKNVYLASGIPEERLHIVPLGVDPSVFHPDTPPYVFTSEPGARSIAADLKDRFVFLFVGGTLHRKGFDILLEAYLKAFSAFDDVCLVVKDTGTRTVYRGQNQRERILGLADDPMRPPIVYLEEEIDAHQLAGVYTACHCLVQPYRGEGFCLPALEAMACGIPVIVPRGGPTDDFVIGPDDNNEVGWVVEAERRPFGAGRIGEWECVGETWMFEVSTNDLGRLMRRVYQDRAEAARRGAAGALRAREGWSWGHSCQVALKRLEAIVQTSTPARAPTPPNRAERRAKSPRARHAGRSDPSPRSQPTISLCMIVRNEERVLGACLESVRPWVDEIVVVDTGSSDRTTEIATEFGATVYHFPWRDDFSAARNESLSHATGDWILWMDADDTIPEESGQRLHELAFLAEERVAGFIIQVRIPPAPGESGFTVVDHVKLFRNLPELRFEGRIHEQILEPIYRAGGTIVRSDLCVIHSGYDHSPEGQRRKRERDLKLLDLDLRDRPGHPFVLFNIGMTAFHMKDFLRAKEALEQCLAASGPRDSTLRKVYAMLAGCHVEQRELDRAKTTVEQGLSLFPADPELLFRAGAIYRDLGDLSAAERSYLTLLTARGVGHIDSLDVSMTGYKARHNLGLVYQDMQRWSDAEAQWRAAVEENGAFLPSWLGLFELYVRLRRFPDAQTVADRISSFDPAHGERLRRRLNDMS